MPFKLYLPTFIGIWGLVWWISAHHVPAYVLPSPVSVFETFTNKGSLLIGHTLITLGQTLAGLLIAVLFGLGSSIFMFFSALCRRFIEPVFLVLQSIPGFVMMPLFILWWGTGSASRLSVVALSCYFPLTLCALKGLDTLPRTFEDVLKTLSARPIYALFWIRLPAAFPYIISGLRLAAIHAPLTVLAVDWIGSGEGLGYLIMLSHSRLETPLLFACVICLLILTFGLNSITLLLEKWMRKHYTLSSPEKG